MAAIRQPIRWALDIYTKTPASLPLLDSDPTLPHAIVFVAGLTDTFGTAPYLDLLARGVEPYGFSVVQLQLSSSLGGWGVCSLEGDAQEMAMAVSWLREKKSKDKVILMGHSTGCQDTMQYLSALQGGSSARGSKAVIDAAVLQAPVSDRQACELMGSSNSPKEKEEAEEKLAFATKCVAEGMGYQIMDRTVAPTLKPERGAIDDAQQLEQKGNVDAVNDPPMTAYRYWSLFSKGGDDDYFSIDLEKEAITRIWDVAAAGLRADGKGYILALLGEQDLYLDSEFVPAPHLTPAKIQAAWKDAAKNGKDAGTRCRFEILPGANHKVDANESQIMLVAKVRELIKAMGVPLRSVSSGSSPTISTSGGSRPTPRGPPPMLPKGIPAWQLAEPATTAASAVPSAATKADATPLSATSNTPDQTSRSLPPPPSGSAVSSVPPHPPSFDALVELIASGRTDEIEGIRDIPLKINEDAPKGSEMQAPRKPWEVNGGGAVDAASQLES